VLVINVLNYTGRNGSPIFSQAIYVYIFFWGDIVVDTFSPGRVLELRSLSRRLFQQSTSISPIFICLLKKNILGNGFRFVPVEAPMFVVSVTPYQVPCRRVNTYGRLTKANSFATNCFDLGLNARICFIAADFQLSDISLSFSYHAWLQYKCGHGSWLMFCAPQATWKNPG
jgi:hypothetical protein